MELINNPELEDIVLSTVRDIQVENWPSGNLETDMTCV